jgi:hypothetical protein
VSDVRGGMSDAALCTKYHLSQNQLEKLYDNLLKAGQLKPSDLDEAAPSFEPTVELAFTCAKCGALKLVDSEKCPQCGDEGLPAERVEPAQESRREQEQAPPELDLDSDDAGADSIFLKPADDLEPLETEHAEAEDEVTFVHDLEPQLDFQAPKEDDRTPLPGALAPAHSAELAPLKPARRGGKARFAALAAVLFALIAAVGAGFYTKMIPIPDVGKLPFIGTPEAPKVKTAAVASRPWEKRNTTSVQPEKKSAGKSEKPVRHRAVHSRTAPRPKVSEAPMGKKKTPAKPTSGSLAETQQGRAGSPKAPPKTTDSSTAPLTRPVAKKKATKAPERPRPPKTEPSQPARKPEPTRMATTSKTAWPAQEKPRLKPEPGPPKTAGQALHVPEPTLQTGKAPVPSPPEAPSPGGGAGLSKASLPGLGFDSGASIGGRPSSKNPALPPGGKPEGGNRSPETLAKTRPGSGAAGESMPAPPSKAGRTIARPEPRPTEKIAKANTQSLDLKRALHPPRNPEYGSAVPEGETPSPGDSRRMASRARAVEPPSRLTPGASAGRASEASRSFETWLLEAAKKGQTDVVRRLLENGVDANAKEKDGTTALMLAAGMGHLAVIRLLLENGADVHSMNDQGVTALGWAYSPPRDMGGSLSVQRRVVRLLKEYGATPVGAGRRRR